MRPRVLVAGVVSVLLLGLTQGVHAGAAAPSLKQGEEDVLPSIVLVIQETTGTLIDTHGKSHGPYDVVFAGTGFFISSDGYIATAAHVASPTPAEVHNELADAYVDDLHNCDPYSAPDQCNGVESKYSQSAVADTTVRDTSTSIQILTQQMDPQSEGIPATIAASSPSNALDTAILKIDGFNEPTAVLGGPDEASIGQAIAVIGYPASSQDGPKGPTMVPTITEGSVTDLTPPDPTSSNAAAANLVQVDAHVEHGNSGGPVVDAQGHVIGLVSFGDLQNVNYLISMADVRSVVARTPALNRLGEIDNLWRDGMTDAAAGRSAQATHEFTECYNMNPAQVYCGARLGGTKAPGEPGAAPGDSSGGGRPVRAALARVPLTYSSSASATTLMVLQGLILILALSGVWIARRRQRLARQPRYLGWAVPSAGITGTLGGWSSARTTVRNGHSATTTRYSFPGSAPPAAQPGPAAVAPERRATPGLQIRLDRAANAATGWAVLPVAATPSRTTPPPPGTPPAADVPPPNPFEAALGSPRVAVVPAAGGVPDPVSPAPPEPAPPAATLAPTPLHPIPSAETPAISLASLAVSRIRIPQAATPPAPGVVPPAMGAPRSEPPAV